MTQFYQICLVFVSVYVSMVWADCVSNDVQETCESVDRKHRITQETQQLMEAVAAVQLYKAQKEVANYLELTYITLCDHPDQAAEVRLTAHSARTQHMMTSGLMKTFMVTARHILDTIIPMFYDAIELKDPDIIIALFDKIVQIANDMKTEAVETQARYREIHQKVQENFASVIKRNKDVDTRGNALKLEKEREEQEAKAAKQEERNLEKMQEDVEDEIQDLRENRNIWRDEAAFSRRNEDEDDLSMFDIPFRSFKAFSTGNWPGLVNDLLHAGTSIFKGIYRSKKMETKRQHILDAYKDSEEKLDRTLDKRREIREKKTRKHIEALQRLTKIKQLIQEEIGLGDAESLREATVYLGRVDTLFIEIIKYWEHMANVIKLIREESNVADVYLRKLENPAYVERLKKQLKKEENHWKFFGRVCMDYSEQTDTEINSLYKFLSAPIDTMAAKERKQRQDQLIREIEDDVNGEIEDDDY